VNKIVVLIGSLIVIVAIGVIVFALTANREDPQTVAPSHEVDPDFAYKQVQSGSVNLTVEDQLSHKKVTLSKDQQADLVRLLYTKSFWAALPVSATAPTIMITVSPWKDTFLMDSQYVYPGTRLDSGIAVAEHEELRNIEKNLK
jgi:hypothetical protein